MTDQQTPEDWFLSEAAQRFGWRGEDEITLRHAYLDEINDQGFTALCDMIQKYEQPPVDRKLLCARKAITQSHGKEFRSNICQWEWIAIRAIELWEQGFGK